jgi:hypothetical protein
MSPTFAATTEFSKSKSLYIAQKDSSNNEWRSQNSNSQKFLF